MGHERIGFLPRTKRWREVVASINDVPTGNESTTAKIADNTLTNVQSRFRRLHADEGIQAAFGYLIALASTHIPISSGLASPDIELTDNTSPVRIASQLNEWVNLHSSSREYAELACRAASDTIVEWTKSHSAQGQLFDESTSASSIWAQAANGAGFCEVSRLFFANLTNRYLRYFLEREASTQISSIEDREKFNDNLKTHVKSVSKHAFETSKITQSFAAGWFNKHAHDKRPSDSEIKSFLAIAFGKLHEEIQREAKQ